MFIITAARRYYSARPSREANNGNEIQKERDVIGPRCTSLPLQQKRQVLCNTSLSSLAKGSPETKLCSGCCGTLLRRRLSYSLMSLMPNPPATSPVESISEMVGSIITRDEYSSINVVDAVEAANAMTRAGYCFRGASYEKLIAGANGNIDKFECDVPCSAFSHKEEVQLAKQKKSDERSMTIKRINILKFDSNEVLTKERTNSGCHWQSSLGCLRPRSGNVSKHSSIVQNSTALQWGGAFKSVSSSRHCDSTRDQTILPSESLSRNVSTSQVTELNALGNNCNESLGCENALKIKKYSYAGLESDRENTNLVKANGDKEMFNKEAFRGIFMLTHKGAQKYSMQIHGHQNTVIKHGTTSDGAQEKSYLDQQTLKPGMNITNQDVNPSNSSKKVLLSLQNAGSPAGVSSADKSKKRSHFKRGCSARALGEIRSCSWCSPTSRVASRKSADSQGTADIITLQNMISDVDDVDMPTQRLLPQNQMRRNLSLKVSDILSTVESIKRLEKCKQLHQTEAEEQRKAVTNANDRSPKKRKLLDVTSKVQPVWPTRIKVQKDRQLRSITPDKKGHAIHVKFGRSMDIQDMDDRLGKNPDDAAYIMRKRDHITTKLLQQTAARYPTKK